jgi:predicted nucleotidyltransferase
MSLSLRPDHERMVRDILARHLPAGFAVRVFGSRTRGAPKPYSDLDLALNGGEPLSLAALADLAEAFSQSDLPFKVDIVDLHSASPTFRAAIETNGVALDP